MSSITAEHALVPTPQIPKAARDRFPARPVQTDWPATRRSREEVLDRLTAAPFVLDNPASQDQRLRGLLLFMDWLQDQPGQTWQQRWMASGADELGTAWRQLPADWLLNRGDFSENHLVILCAALNKIISADIVRPSLGWFQTGAASRGHIAKVMVQTRDPEGFGKLQTLCDNDATVSETLGGLILHRAALIVGTKGGSVADITIGDVIELLDEEKASRTRRPNGLLGFYRILRQAGVFGDQAPATLRELATAGQLTPDQLIDQYRLACQPIRDLLVDYLRERQPALDYTSLEALARTLGKQFWADLEQHNPGIASLHLPVEVADAWKLRLRTVTRTVTNGSGDKVEVLAERVNFRECLTPIRAFYLDLAHWAVEEPSRWSRRVAPCPIGAEEINRRKHKRHRKARMDARTRERLPVLPTLVRSVNQRRTLTAERLTAALQTPPGHSFTAGGETLRRAVTRRTSGRIWADEPVTGNRRDLTLEDDHAFWAWAAVEVLRATGIRVEELTELTHHSLVQYRLPTTGEIVPLLQIAPSKTDRERLLLVSPELADVLSAIIHRIRDASGAIPLVPAYDCREKTWSPPRPVLFQRPANSDNRAITDHGIRKLLTQALTHTGLTDTATGETLRYTPHDFRRLFITDAILSGLPPHIAQIIAGHQDINVTLGYKAVYPEEAIQSHLAFLARRRALRPTDEYRTPTDEEWTEFLGHFERRKVSTGTCGRAFGTPCIHEHACIRCPMLWPDPAQHGRLVEIRDNLIARITEAQREGWLGEVEGLQVSLAGAEDKLAQINRRTHKNTSVNLGIPKIK